MPSPYIFIPALIFCAPLILSVVGTFTAFAAITSVLALTVVAIRLGFLVIEFSGGFLLDSITWCVRKVIPENPHNDKKNSKKNSKDISNKKLHQHHHGKKLHKSKQNILATSKISPKMTTLWENTDGFNGFVNNFVSKDDYFMASNKRPNGRRARSDFI
ncbi:20694_t:CDS:1 [Funneliformis geosporum]|uniref:19608_t:CDS:1 n=1 Tax=Funneliformis geosporum TaxID=1117311 RepID=A0A9W4SB38_9GLOM|nr:20694_t:CDS:1 [Funneliformis geosporum]CAI2162129.1 19608_t:CDS:1 [Funneliformis geosporum]